MTDADFDGIDPSIPAGSLEYWKARARQWENRCRRAEREKTELINEIAELKAKRPRTPPLTHRRARADAILRGDLLA